MLSLPKYTPGLKWIHAEALYILTSTTKQRFEFIFTDYGTNPSHFASIFEIYKIYQATALYRELKLRSAILTDGQLNILPQEQVYNQLSGIYNLSSDQVCMIFILSCVNFACACVLDCFKASDCSGALDGLIHVDWPDRAVKIMKSMLRVDYIDILLIPVSFY